MASLSGKKIKDTYKSLLKVSDNGEVEITDQEMTDGAGNPTGVSFNTQGDVSATGTVSFGSLKDSGENITVTKFVDEADGIDNNDNDTSIPTSAAVKDYVDNNITAQDLDITDGTNNGSVDLDSQSLTFTGDAGVSATVSGQTLTLDSSALQSQITSNDSDISGLDTRLTNAETNISSNDTDIASLQTDLSAEETARIAADTTLQSNIDSEASTRLANDTTLQTNIDTEQTNRISADAALQSAIDTEETARLAGDAALQTEIDDEATTRAAADTVLHDEIDDEITARSAADVTLQSNIDAEEAARIAADSTLTTSINNEATTRASADTTLQSNIDAEESARISADSGLQTQITSNDSDISGLDTRLTTAETNISGNDTDIAALDTRLTTAESNITSNDSDISGLDTRLTTAESDITSLETGKQDVSEKGVANGYAGLDSNGFVPTSQLPESVTGALEYQGTWDASTNTPTLPTPSSTNKGHFYKVSVEGTYNSILFHVGDWALSDGTNWDHIHTQETVSDVFGREGSITAQQSDYSAFYPLLSDLATTDANVLANTTKLAGIEAGADVTDATNVAAAGALMDGTAVISDLADVSTTSPSNGQVLTYNSTSGEWEPAASGAAPVTSVNTQTGAVVLDADDIDDTATTNKFTSAADISKLAGIETGADVTDTANVVAALTAGTNITIAGDGTISATDTNTTYTAGSGLLLTGTQFSHSDTSSAADLSASGRTYVTGLTFDTFGHVTGYTTGTETVVDTNTTYSAGSGVDLNGTTFSHTDTSSQASVNNSNGTVIQDVTLDTYGHVTGLASVDLDGRYYTEAEVDARDATKVTIGGTVADQASWNNATKFQSSGDIATTTAGNHSLQVYAANGNDAFMAFHIASDYAVYLGLDGADNQLKIGGWSIGANKYKIWHEGNDGSGSGLDADTVDGIQGSSIITTSNIGSQSVSNADTVDGQHAQEMSWGHQYVHSTFTNFNSFLNTNYFGAHFVQGTTNSPGHGGASQYYHQRMSLGSEYNNYSLQFAIPRNRTDSYLYYRNEENGSASAWYKMNAGYADSAGISSQVTINYNNNSNSTYQMLWGSGNSVYGTAAVYLNPSSNYVYANSFNAGDWFRSSGQSGWYNSTYAGGIYMIDATWVRTYNNKAFYVSNTGSEAIATAGDVVAYYSDMRLKEKTGDIENAVDKVKQLSGFYYVENEKAKELGYDNDKVQIGVSAQEVQAVIPEAVRRAPIDIETLEDGTEVSKTGEDYLTVKYERLVPLLIEAIKEQQNQIDELKQLLNNKI